MKQTFAALILLGAGVFVPTAGAGQPAIDGTWEAARTVNDERLYIVLSDTGKGRGRGRIRASHARQKTARAFQHLRHVGAQGNEIVVTYGNVMRPPALRGARAACGGGH